MKVSDIPQWALDHKVEFEQATAGIKAVVRADKFVPKWFALQGGGDRLIFICWNARRVETYGAQDIPDHLR